jgi:SAM-dependent methyltransferase
MPHIFNPDKAEILDSKERAEIEPVDPVIDRVAELGKREIAVEVGAGTGYYTIHLSKIFKRVYAIDVSFKMAQILKKKLEKRGIINVGIIVTDEPPALDFPIDLILFANVLHEMERPETYLGWATKAEHVLILEWKKKVMTFGPPVEERISEEEMVEMLSGFEIEEIDTATLPFHYLILARPKK